MRILQFTNFYHYPLAGTERYVRTLSSNLVERGHDVHIVYTPITYDKNNKNRELDVLEGTTLAFIPDRIGFFKLFNEVRKFDPDIIHTYYLKTGIRAAVIGLILKKPVVNSLLLADKPNKGIVRRLAGKLFGFVFRSIHYIAISDYIEESIKEEVKDAKVTHISCWTWNYEKMQAGTEKKFKERFPEGSKIIITVTRIIEQKGIEYLIEAAKGVSSVRDDCYFALVGFGEAEEKYKQMVSDLGIDDRFKFMGPLYYDDLVDAYDSSDIIVIPSLMDCLFALTESLVTGKPIIGTDVECITEIINNKENGIIVQKGNAEQIKDAILELLDDENLYKKIVENAKKTGENYSADNCISKIENLYKTILEKKS